MKLKERLCYLVRHCKATGQEADAPLTADGLAQSQRLASFLQSRGVNRIISSPFKRALQSAEPLALAENLDIAEDVRLVEHDVRLSGFDHWMDGIRASLEDLDLTEGGAETARAAMARGRASVDEALSLNDAIPALFTHGKLLTLVQMSFSSSFGFDSWKSLSNPDVFVLRCSCAEYKLERIWG